MGKTDESPLTDAGEGADLHAENVGHVFHDQGGDLLEHDPLLFSRIAG